MRKALLIAISYFFFYNSLGSLMDNSKLRLENYYIKRYMYRNSIEETDLKSILNVSLR